MYLFCVANAINTRLSDLFYVLCDSTDDRIRVLLIYSPVVRCRSDVGTRVCIGGRPRHCQLVLVVDRHREYWWLSLRYYEAVAEVYKA